MKKILLLATDNDDTKIFLWSLRHCGYTVFAAGHREKNGEIIASVLCRKFFEIPQNWTLENKSEGIIGLLRRIVRENEIEVLLPTGFESIKYLSYFRKNIEPFVPIISLPNGSLIDELGNKFNFSNYCHSHNIPHPYVHYVADYTGFENIKNEIKFPVLTKPIVSSAGRGIHKFEQVEELDNYFKKESTKKCRVFPLLLQKYIDGEDYGFCAYANEGFINAWTIMRFIEIPRKGDKPLLWIQFQRNDDVLKVGKDIVARSQYSGPINIDMRVDTNNGCVYALEVNTRFWARTFYSLCDGVNFADVAVRCVYDKKIKVEPRYSNKIWGSPHRLLPLILKHRERKYVDYALHHTFFQVWHFVLDKYFTLIGKLQKKINKNWKST